MAIDIEELYRRYGPMVLRRCRFLLGDEEKAVDASQDVFVELLRRRDELKPEAPSSLLYTIATRVCLNRLRSERRRPAVRDEAAILEAADSSDFVDRIGLNSVLDALFEDEREDTRLMAAFHYVDRLTFEETAQLVGLSVSGVRKRLAKLRRKALAFKEA
jgi:RNA polymerase sigma-70 factor (ECF subfamily)